MRAPTRGLLLALLVVTSGCTYRAMLDRIAPKEEVEFAKEHLGHLRAGRLDDVERDMDPALVGPATRAKLVEMSSYFPPGEPRTVELIGANVWRGPDWWSANLSFQYEFGDGWIAANVVLERKNGGPLLVTGVHVERLPTSLQRVHAFALRGKRAVHYLFVVAALLVASSQLTMLVVCLRARDVRRKWLWALFTLFGVTTLNINWTTGQIAFMPFSAHLFSVGAVTSGPYAPWFITMSFPLGAMVFLMKWMRSRNARLDSAEHVSSSDAA